MSAHTHTKLSFVGLNRFLSFHIQTDFLMQTETKTQISMFLSHVVNVTLVGEKKKEKRLHTIYLLFIYLNSFIGIKNYINV